MTVGPLRIGVAGAGNIASIAQLPTLVARTTSSSGRWSPGGTTLSP